MSNKNYCEEFYDADAWEFNKAITKAFDKQKDVILASQHIDASCINLSSIATYLIQETGRFCDSYASDFLIDWNRVLKCIEEIDEMEGPYRVVVGFGIRENGVDGNCYITTNINENRTTELQVNKYNSYKVINDHYRRIYAVEIRKIKEYGDFWNIIVTLKDIRRTIRYEDTLITSDEITDNDRFGEGAIEVNE